MSLHTRNLVNIADEWHLFWSGYLDNYNFQFKVNKILALPKGKRKTCQDIWKHIFIIYCGCRAVIT